MGGVQHVVRVNLTHITKDEIIDLINQEKWVLSKYDIETTYEEGVGLDVYANLTFFTVDEPWFIEGESPFRTLTLCYTDKKLNELLYDVNVSLIKVLSVQTKIGTVFIADYTLEPLPL